jgi:hypothetical protein
MGGGVDWIHVTTDRRRRGALVKAVFADFLDWLRTN